MSRADPLPTEQLKPCPMCGSPLREWVNRCDGYGAVEYQGITACTSPDACTWFIVWPSNARAWKRQQATA